MKPQRKISIWGVIFALVLVYFAVTGLISLFNALRDGLRMTREQPAQESIVIEPGQNYTLSGVLNDSLVVTADQITLEQGSLVTGNASLIGNRIVIDGQINGSLSIAAADTIEIGEGAQINGGAELVADQTTLNGQINGALRVTGDQLSFGENSAVNGGIDACVDQIDGERVGYSQTCVSDIIIESPPIWAGVWSALVLTGVTTLTVTLFPLHVANAEDALQRSPRVVFGWGAAAFVILLGLGGAYVSLMAAAPPIGLLLVPAAFLVGAVVLVGFVAAWVVVSLLTGEILTGRFMRGRFVPPLIGATMGSIALLIPLNVLAVFPFGSVIALVLGGTLLCGGLGAALRTRFGTQTVRRARFVQG